MSQQNAEILTAASRSASLGVTAEEREWFLDMLDTAVEWVAHAGGPPGMEGHFGEIEAAQGWYRRWTSTWEEWDWEIEDARERRSRGHPDAGVGTGARKTPPGRNAHRAGLVVP